jgi:hypothetical protein
MDERQEEEEKITNGCPIGHLVGVARLTTRHPRVSESIFVHNKSIKII